jgi:hypothetical protein
MSAKCFECRAGEHDDIKEDAVLCVIHDPETKKIFRRGYLCSDHINVFLDDGYIVQK